MINKDGIATQDLIDSITPDKERLNKCGIAVVECFQNIPCNPCYTCCPRGAMRPMTNINDRPQVDPDKCNGCGVCVSHCPGLAIVVVDQSYSDNEALIKLPYEFLPLPEVDDIVNACDRTGKTVCKGVINKVVNTKANDRTPVVWLVIPKEYSMVVRFFKFEEDTPKINYEIPKDDGDITICRCEELTLKQLRKYISEGYTTVDEIKRISRAGMGACQGRTCRQLIINEIAHMTGQKPQDIVPSTFRPPVKPVSLEFLCNSEEDDNE